jgi:hypothetical protein
VQFKRGKASAAPQLTIYYAANAAFQTAATLLASRRRLSRLNWPFWTRRDSLMPAMVITAGDRRKFGGRRPAGGVIWRLFSELRWTRGLDCEVGDNRGR